MPPAIGAASTRWSTTGRSRRSSTSSRSTRSYLLVNIGNEVGDDSVSDGQFIAGYTNAVQRMRTAGIHTPLVIDAPDWGKNLETLNNTAAQLLAADPDHNLIFSVHMYWGIADGANAQFIQDQFCAAVAANYPLIVGEFSQTGAYDPDVGDSSCSRVAMSTTRRSSRSARSTTSAGTPGSGDRATVRRARLRGHGHDPESDCSPISSPAGRRRSLPRARTRSRTPARTIL